MIKDITYFGLFPILVYSSFLDRKITEEEKSLVLYFSKNAEKNTSNNVTKEHNVLNKKQFQNIKNFIQENLQIYLKNIVCPKNNVDLYITESWLNYNNKDEGHHTHYHDNSYLSGVFYFNTLSNDNIIFLKNKVETFNIETENYNLYNSSDWKYPIKDNQLIIFPSYLRHEVKKNTENKTRISLAFNIFLKGEISKINSTFLKI